MVREEKLKEIKEFLNYNGIQNRVSEVSKLLQSEEVWQDWEKGQEYAKELKSLKNEISEIDDLEISLLEEDYDKFDEKYIAEQNKLNDVMKGNVAPQNVDVNVDVNEFEQLKKKVNDLENVVKNLLEILNN